MASRSMLREIKETLKMDSTNVSLTLGIDKKQAQGICNSTIKLSEASCDSIFYSIKKDRELKCSILKPLVIAHIESTLGTQTQNNKGYKTYARRFWRKEDYDSHLRTITGQYPLKVSLSHKLIYELQSRFFIDTLNKAFISPDAMNFPSVFIQYELSKLVYAIKQIEFILNQHVSISSNGLDLKLLSALITNQSGIMEQLTPKHSLNFMELSKETEVLFDELNESLKDFESKVKRHIKALELLL